MKAVVTGGAGFIGSHLTEELVRQGHEVVVYDNLFSGKKEHLAAVQDKTLFVQGDIRDQELLKKTCAGADIIFHQAALRSVPASVDDPAPYNDVNIIGTFNVLETARRMNVPQVIFASSSSVYGEKPKIPQKEGYEDVRLSPYAITKYTGEDYCAYFYKTYGIKTVALRYFNVFGPRQDPNAQYAAVIPKFILSLLKKESPPIFGTGEQSRDFTFVHDVVAANLCASRAKKAAGKAFNIAQGRPISVNALATMIAGILNSEIKPTYFPARQGDVMHTSANITRARKLLKLPEPTPFEEALKQTVEWFKQTFAVH